MKSYQIKRQLYRMFLVFKVVSTWFWSTLVNSKCLHEEQIWLGVQVMTLYWSFSLERCLYEHSRLPLFNLFVVFWSLCLVVVCDLSTSSSAFLFPAGLSLQFQMILGKCVDVVRGGIFPLCPDLFLRCSYLPDFNSVCTSSFVMLL